jgi:hypothetical protein
MSLMWHGIKPVVGRILAQAQKSCHVETCKAADVQSVRYVLTFMPAVTCDIVHCVVLSSLSLCSTDESTTVQTTKRARTTCLSACQQSTLVIAQLMIQLLRHMLTHYGHFHAHTGQAGTFPDQRATQQASPAQKSRAQSARARRTRKVAPLVSKTRALRLSARRAAAPAPRARPLAAPPRPRPPRPRRFQSRFQLLRSL